MAARLVSAGPWLVQCAPLSTRRGEYSQLPATMCAFRERHGHFAVPHNFSVPAQGEAWPAELRGLRLGRRIGKFVAALAVLGDAKQRRQSPKALELEKVRAELSDAGFPAVDDWRRFLWEQQALRAFRAARGHLLVPYDFCVPTGDHAWPKAAWGLRLGVLVNNLRLRRHKLLRDQAEDLEQLGFVWSVPEHRWALVKAALRHYRRSFGHCDVEQGFVVPSADPWPEGAHGMRLGAVVNKMRSRGDFADQVARDEGELEEIGFVWESQEERWRVAILPAILAFHAVHGNSLVPNDFVVPHDETLWPRRSWGLKLGRILVNIRLFGGYEKQVECDRAKLDTVGFRVSKKSEG